MVDSIAPAVGNFFANFLASSVGQNNTERNMLTQHQMNKDIMNLQHQQNLQNMLSAGQYERRSRENAGLNVNNGQPFTPVGTSAVGSTAPSGSQMSPIDFAQFQVASAQARLLDTEADLNKRKLLGQKEEDAWYSRIFQHVPDVDYNENGDLVFGTNASVQNEGKTSDADMSGTLPDTVSVGSKLPPSTTKEGAEARKLARQRLDTELKKLRADDLKAELEGAISSAQLDDPEVMSAFFKQPYWAQEFVIHQISELIAREFAEYQSGALAISSKNLNVLEKDMSTNGIIDGIEKDLEGGNPVDAGKKIAKGLVKLAIRKLFGSSH